MQTYSQRLVRGTIIIFAFMFISALLGYGQKFVFTRALSVQDIGLIYSVLGFVSFFIFLRDLGLSDALLFYLPRHLVDGDKKKIKATILFSLFVHLAIGALFFILFALLSRLLADHYFQDNRAIMLLIAFGVYFITDGLNEVLISVFHSYQNMFLYQAMQFGFQLFSFLFFLLFIYYSVPVSLFGLVYIIASVLNTVLFFLMFQRFILPDFFRIKTKITKGMIQRMLKFSFPTMIGNLASDIFAQQSIFFITFFLGLEAVGFYVFAQALAKVSFYFFKSMIVVFFPMMTELWKRKDTKELVFRFNQLISYAYIVAVPMSLAALFFSKPIIELVYTEKFVPAAPLFGIFGIYFLFMGLSSIIHKALLSSGNPEPAKNLIVIKLVINLVLNLILIPTIGLIGAGLADLISMIITSALSVLKATALLKIKFDWKKQIKTALAGIIFVASAWPIYLLLPLQELYRLMISFSVAGLVYLLLIFALKLVTFKEINNFIRIFTNNKFSLWWVE